MQEELVGYGGAGAVAPGGPRMVVHPGPGATGTGTEQPILVVEVVELEVVELQIGGASGGSGFVVIRYKFQ